jgi:sulfoxide reductase heme-binding subunit YedZ
MKLAGRRARIAVWGLGLLPFGVLAYEAFSDDLGPDPVEALTLRTGSWALRFLVACLAISPARTLLGLSGLAPHRRTLGLLALFYACLHFAVYLVLEIELDGDLLVESVVERPFVSAGFACLLAMLPLGVTSTRGAIRRLGARWRTLHRLAYGALLLAVLHFAWGVKADLLEPFLYAGATALLLGFRLTRWSGRNRAQYASLRGSSKTG